MRRSTKSETTPGSQTLPRSRSRDERLKSNGLAEAESASFQEDGPQVPHPSRKRVVKPVTEDSELARPQLKTTRRARRRSGASELSISSETPTFIQKPPAAILKGPVVTPKPPAEPPEETTKKPNIASQISGPVNEEWNMTESHVDTSNPSNPDSNILHNLVFPDPTSLKICYVINTNPAAKGRKQKYDTAHVNVNANGLLTYNSPFARHDELVKVFENIKVGIPPFVAQHATSYPGAFKAIIISCRDNVVYPLFTFQKMAAGGQISIVKLTKGPSFDKKGRLQTRGWGVNIIGGLQSITAGLSPGLLGSVWGNTPS